MLLVPLRKEPLTKPSSEEAGQLGARQCTGTLLMTDGTKDIKHSIWHIIKTQKYITEEVVMPSVLDNMDVMQQHNSNIS